MTFYNHDPYVVGGFLLSVFNTIVSGYGILCWSVYILPIAKRLGTGIQKREFAIFADDSAFGDLRECLVDSKIFKGKNISQIRDGNIDKAKGKTIFLVDLSSLSIDIEKVFDLRKNEQVPVIIYAKPGSIQQDKMVSIANRANTVVVNFRGRLLNDVVTSLMTTSSDGS